MVDERKERSYIDYQTLVKSYDFVLVDNCAFNVLSQRQERHNREIGIRRERDKFNFMHALIGSIHEGRGIYFTPGIFREIEEANKDQYINRFCKNKKKGKTRQRYDLARAIQAEDDKQRHLAEEVRKYDRVLMLDEDEFFLYAKLMDDYYFIKEREDLSEADLQFLFCGMVLSQTRGKTAIISNDFDTLFAYSDIMRCSSLAPDRFGFFIRRYFPGFERGFVRDVK